MLNAVFRAMTTSGNTTKLVMLNVLPTLLALNPKNGLCSTVSTLSELPVRARMTKIHIRRVRNMLTVKSSNTVRSCEYLLGVAISF